MATKLSMACVAILCSAKPELFLPLAEEANQLQPRRRTKWCVPGAGILSVVEILDGEHRRLR
jgi:hypothetical protein